MFTFTSVNNRYRIFGKPIKGEPEYDVKFEPIGSMGKYTTVNAELAEKLRKHPDFGKRFMEIGVQAKENPNVVRDTRSSSTKPELGQEQPNAEKLIEFGRLQMALLKKDGSFRKDASEEDKLKYETLKQELGV